MSEDINRKTGQNNPSTDSTSGSKSVKPEQIEPTVPDWMFRVVDIKAKQSGVHRTKPDEQQTESANRLVDKVKRSDRWMILLTSIIAFATVANVVVFWLQSQDTSRQVDKLLVSTGQLAESAKSQAAESKKQAENTRALATAAADQAKAAINQVDQLKASVKAGQASAQAASKATQAWIALVGLKYIGVENSRIKVAVTLNNIGTTPVLNVKLGFAIHFLPKFDIRKVRANPWNCPTVNPGPGYTQPNRPWTNEISHGPYSDLELKGFAENKTMLYIYGCVVYEDVLGNKHRVTRIALFYPADDDGPRFAIDPQNSQME